MARAKTRFKPQAYVITDSHLLPDAQVVDVTYNYSSIYVLWKSALRMIASSTSPIVNGFQDLQMIIGHVDWRTAHEILDNVKSLEDGFTIGASNGSVHHTENRASHAWIIHTSNGSEIIGRCP